METWIERLNGELAEIVQKARPSLAHIRTSRHAGGSATIVGEDGLLVTNAHIVNGREADVTFADGRSDMTKPPTWPSSRSMMVRCLRSTWATQEPCGRGSSSSPWAIHGASPELRRLGL